jgi:hypothetical protein
MTDPRVAWVLAVSVMAPVAAHAADEPAALLRKAAVYAFEAKQYGAAGKPVTNAIAKRHAMLSWFYRTRATEAHPDR